MNKFGKTFMNWIKRFFRWLEYSFNHRYEYKTMKRVLITFLGSISITLMICMALIKMVFVIPYVMIKNVVTGKPIITIKYEKEK